MTFSLYFAAFGIIVGVLFFARGFNALIRKRVIENTPTSKIRSMAMGQIKIAGTATQDHILAAPFSKKHCVYYQYAVQDMCQSKGSTFWETIHHGDSSSSPFHLKDDTGRALINPMGMAVDLPITYEKQIHYFEEVPKEIGDFLDAKAVPYKGWFGGHVTLRFLEYAIEPGMLLYVMGVCRTNRDHLVREHQKKLHDVLQQLKQNPEYLARFDADHDRKISVEEWEIARQTIEMKLDLSEAQEDRVLIGNSLLPGGVSFISSDPESNMIQKLSGSTMGGIIGGPILSILNLYWLLHILNLH